VNFKSEETGGIRTIRIYGDINKFELQGLRQSLADLKPLSEAVIDLTEVDFAGSDFLNLFLDIRHHQPADFGKIVFVNPNELVQELFEMTQINKLYRVRQIAQEAVSV
jgi:anti-anti-sigma factor